MHIKIRVNAWMKIFIQTTWHGISSPRDYFFPFFDCNWVQCKFKRAMNAARLEPAITADDLVLVVGLLLVDSARSSFLTIQTLPSIVWQSSGATSGVETFWTISKEVDPSRSFIGFKWVTWSNKSLNHEGPENDPDWRRVMILSRRLREPPATAAL